MAMGLRKASAIGAGTLACLLLLNACADNPKPRTITTQRGAPRAAPRLPVCVDFSFPIYFDTNSGQLTAAAESVVRDAGERLQGCAIGRVEVLGLADAVGSASANLAVSRRRAAAVADALARAGLPRPSFEVAAAGASGALTPEGTPEPLRRRVEVVVRASPSSPGTAPSAPGPAAPPTATTR